MVQFLKRLIIFIVVVVLIGYALLHIFTTATNDADWDLQYAKPASAELSSDEVKIHDIRNFTYTSPSTYDTAYYDRTVNLSKIQQAYFVTEPFSAHPGVVRSFVTFLFDKDQYVSIAVDIRKTSYQHFSPWFGLLNQYQIIYTIADERDLITQRVLANHDRVDVYPMTLSADQTRSLFVDMISRANYYKDHPEFYNTLTKNSTRFTLNHIGRALNKSIPWTYQSLFPQNADHVLYDLGAIPNDISFQAVQAKYNVDSKVLQSANDTKFSTLIRATN